MILSSSLASEMGVISMLFFVIISLLIVGEDSAGISKGKQKIKEKK